MPLDYPAALNLRTCGAPFSWSDREVMLYALGVGMGSDPLKEEELQFVNEAFATSKPLKVIPTFASVCVWGARPGVIDLNRVMVVDARTRHYVSQANARRSERDGGRVCEGNL
ncbi:hypothetical protein [Bradyrhizobium genosp. SA-3]|uniref:hypothetical protein n=1 Tax=Bradyrhizobium genosp. SA-3 TaxID=508868 RepID=UPI00102A0482|nr:hypothetical protein [Bradyrhizobium genosp. SA-3]